MQKVLVIGLDGGCFDQLLPLMDQGLMPRLRALMARGAHGPLRSVIPAVTAPAWVSFMTGSLPCRHGVFDFLRSDQRGGPRRVVNMRDIAVPTLWEVLAAQGRKIGCFNVPVTYPPLALDGFMWSGLLTPSEAGSRRCSPPHLVEELENRFGRFQPDVSLRSYLPKEKARLIRDAIACLDQKGKYTGFLMERSEWDFFMTVITETDRIQHVFTPEIGTLARMPGSDSTGKTGGGRRGSNGSGNREVLKLLREFYGRVDAQVGRLCDMAGPDVDVFIVSDHGFGPLERLFFPNQWLQQQGYLTLKQAARLHLQTRLIRLAVNPALRSLVRRLDIFRFRDHLTRRMDNPMIRFSNVFDATVDWSRTKAYMENGTQQGIHINLRGRQPHGIVEPGAEYERTRDEIVEALRNVPDPRTGAPMRVEVWRREEIYTGPLAHESPDIIFSLDEMRTMALAPIRREPGLFMDPIWPILAHHRMDGMFVAAGPGFAPGAIEGARLIDVMPTVLQAMNLAIPHGLDGASLERVFTAGFRASSPPRFSTPPGTSPPRADAGEALTAEESLKVEQSLRDLGYIE